MARYAISDLHGHYELFKTVKDKLRTEDLLYVLGDCADRGPDGWKTLAAVIEDPQCILLLGNHELMLRETMLDWFTLRGQFHNDEYADDDIIFTQSYCLLSMNGGEQTFWDWRKEKDLDYWYQRLQILPLRYQIFDSRCGRPIILTHAGYTPWKRPEKEEDYVWNRNHFFDKWDEKEPMSDGIIIHGHTPQEYLIEVMENCLDIDKTKFKILGTNFQNEWHIYDLTYCDGHKICIDPGTVISKMGLIINLDTLEQEVIRFPLKKII